MLNWLWHKNIIRYSLEVKGPLVPYRILLHYTVTLVMRANEDNRGDIHASHRAIFSIRRSNRARSVEHLIRTFNCERTWRTARQ
jgi:hypothetical protein